jgi:hypothetical protein
VEKKGIILANTKRFGGQQEESAAIDGFSRLFVGHLFSSDKNWLTVHGCLHVCFFEVSCCFADNASCPVANEEFQFQVR